MAVRTRTAARGRVTTTGRVATKKASASKLKGGVVGTRKALKKSATASTGQWIKTIPEEGIIVRFLQEPEEWISYMRYYDEGLENYIPLLDGEDAPKGARVQQRYATNALDTDADRVIVIDIPKSLLKTVLKLLDKYDTLVDRDYELSRTGTGLDTDYDILPEDKIKRNVSKYELSDVEEFILNIRDANLNPTDDDEDEESEEETPRRGRARADAKKASRRAAIDEDEDEYEEDEEEEEDEDEEYDEDEDEEDEEEDEDEDEEDEDEDELLTEEDIAAMSSAELREWCEYYEIAKPKSKAATITAILNAQDEAIAAESGEEEEEEEEEGEELDEASLKKLKIADLRELAEEYDIDTDGMNKAALIEALLETDE